MQDNFEPGKLEILWNRFISAADDQATALKEASFTSIVRESDDLSAGIFDDRGWMMAQAVTGSPGHINSLAEAMRHFVACFPDPRPGDVMITNDPWLNSGHLNDVTVVTPVHVDGRLVGFVGSTCHQLDIGGRGLGADAADVYEEGFCIPPMLLYEEGQINASLVQLIRANLRIPSLALGDIHAQVASNDVAIERVREIIRDFELRDLRTLADEIASRSEKRLRRAIAAIPDGQYEASVDLDGVESALSLAVALHVKGSELVVDFDKSSEQSLSGINVVMNYTSAYTTYAINCALAPGVPHNEGTFRSIQVKAPRGSILNTLRPAPVAARHTVGHFIPNLILDALATADPSVSLAHGSSSLWVTNIRATATIEHDPFVAVLFASGGMGARAQHDGLNTISFPSGAATTPIEEMEVNVPVLVHEKALIPDSGGVGEHRGGLGQRIRISVMTGQPWSVTCLCNRLDHAAEGVAGGGAGRRGRVLISDQEISDPRFRRNVPNGESVTLELPGGGGVGDPAKRDPKALTEDYGDGKITYWPTA